ncbi:MAG: FtsQ-type POTRA domain-containing protein [Kiritimatiellae bacterium]|nr:FtsQ-type POTRA domain-containing protein [Kiritimatiellia bacterium]
MAAPSSRKPRRNRARESVLRAAAHAVESRRASRRRWGIAAVVLLGAAALGAGAWLGGRWVWERCFLHNDYFGIRHVEISTDGTLDPALVREYAGVREGMNLFEVHPDAVRSNLLAVPVVASVSAGRRFPDTVVIDIAERTPVARLGTRASGTPLAADATGHVLGPSSVRADLPIVSGLRDKALRPGDVIGDPLMATALRILEICARPDLRREMRVAQVDISSDTWITLALADGGQILLSHDGLETKLERFPLMRDAARRRGLDLAIYNMTSDANYAATPRGGPHP